jgi:peptidoglycan/xylan/chitin deacetylase (PgdA/CDA1 family)
MHDRAWTVRRRGRAMMEQRMVSRAFPRSVAACAVGVALAVAASSCSRMVEAVPLPPPPAHVRLDHKAVSVPRGMTFQAFAESEGLSARDGRLLSVSGEILERHISDGSIELNGRTPEPLHLLENGDRIVLVEGVDRTEGTKRVTATLPGRANAFVQRTLATYRVREITTVGRRSGEVADVRMQTIGPAHTPNAVALTFDDGPWPDDTEALLRVLRRVHVHATFFMVGSLVDEHPDIVREVLDAGHVIANHSMTHPIEPPFADLLDRHVEAEITGANDALRAAGAEPTLFRPPGGSYDDAVVLEAWRQHERVVLWSVDPRDWDAARTSKQIAKSVLQHVHAGSIVLMHDGGGDAADTIAALPKIIRGIKKMGLDLVTLDPYRRT